MNYRSFSEQTKHYFNRQHLRIPSSLLSAPSAWRGDDLRRKPETWTYVLTDSDIAEIEHAVDSAPTTLADIVRENFALPELSQRIRGWQHQLAHGLGLQLIKGLPVHYGEDWVQRAFWGIGHHLGQPGGQNPAQELLGHVKDYAEDDPTVRLYRTPGDIAFHCDAADVVGLLCLDTAATGGQSRVVSTVTLFNELFQARQDLLPIVFAEMKLDGRGERPAEATPYSTVVPCRYDGATLRTFYHSNYMRSVERLDGVELTHKQRQTLDFYDSHGNEEALYLEMNLEPGDLQFISNHTTAHARTAYQDGPQQKRHLLRLWLSL